MKSYRLSEEARQDYFDAFDYIAQHNSSAALKWESNMLAVFDHLAEWPCSGRIRPEIAPAHLRFWIIGDYVLLYDPSAQPLSIIAILHGAQDIAALIAARIEDGFDDDGTNLSAP